MPPVPLSPLRYPGGKTRFVPHFVKWLGDERFPRVVEPFCGGASVSLGLLKHNMVDTAVISDADPLIAAFWRVATTRTEEFIELMREEPVSVTRWTYWKNKHEQGLSPMGRAMKTLYLNRTSFSGLIRFGSVLGGVNQDQVLAEGGTVKYPVGCRFNKDALAASLTQIGKWHDEGRLLAQRRDYTAALKSVSPDDLVYLDPPYVEKADQLYGLSFGEHEHRDLAAWLYDHQPPTVISYDDLPLIRELYSDGMTVLEPSWSYGMGKSKKSRELLIHNLKGRPDDFD